MAEPVVAPMPRDLDLAGSYTIRFTALNPTTGAVVPGVVVTDMVLTVQPGSSTSPSDLAVGPWLIVPGAGA